MVVVQGEALNRSRLAPVVCVPLTSTLWWADAPGNLPLTARTTGLPHDVVANVSQVVAVDKTRLGERVSKLSRAKVEVLLSGIDVGLGRYPHLAIQAASWTGGRVGDWRGGPNGQSSRCDLALLQTEEEGDPFSLG